MNKKILLALVVFSAVFCMAQTPAVQPVTGKVNADFLNMRIGAGLDSPVAGKISGGSEVKILREVGNWLEIAAPQSLKVYVSEARVNPDGVLNGELNMRSAMSTTAPILGVLPKGSKVERIDERRNGWVRIVPPQSIKLYVAAFCINYDRNAFQKATVPEVKIETKAPETQAVETKVPEVKIETKAPEVVPAVKEEKISLRGVLTSWKFSRSAETAYALLDAPNGRNLGFVTAGDPAKLAALDGKNVLVNGKITGKTDAGALIINADEVIESTAK